MASCTGYEPTEAGGPFGERLKAVQSRLQAVQSRLQAAPFSNENPLGMMSAADVRRYTLPSSYPGYNRPYDPKTNTNGYISNEILAKLTTQQRMRIVQDRRESIDPAYHAEQKAMRDAEYRRAHPKSGLSKIGSAIGGAVTSAAKAVTAVPRAVGGAALDVAKGKNVLQTLKSRGAEFGKNTIQGAKVLGNVATVLPGVGTAAAFAIRYTANVADAVASGKNVLGSLEHSAIDAALNSLPGGELTGAAIKTVANLAKAGIQGKNVLKSAATELTGAAISMVPSSEAQTVLKGAADAALRGENVLQGAKGAAIRAALSQVPSGDARAAIEGALQGKSPESIVKNAGASLLSAAAAAVPTGGAAAVVTGITGKSPNQLIESGKAMKPAFILKSAPTTTPRPGVARPSLIAPRAAERTLERRTSLPRPMRGVSRVSHQPLSNRAKMFVRNKGGAVARDVSGLTQDGKWLVQAGDTGQKIAKAVTGDSNRWKELIAVNPKNMTNKADVKAYGFPVYTYKYNPINLPASWVKPTVVSQPAPSPAAVPTVPAAPSVIPTVTQTPAQTILTQIQTVLAPAGDVAAQGQARAILASWGKTDGTNAAGVPDYGGMSEIGATSWSARDVLMAASFGRWFDSNIAATHGVAAVGSSGQWGQPLSDALHYWAENKAAQVLPGVVAAPSAPAQSTNLPQLPAATVATQTPGVTVSPASTTVQTPSGGGVISLPGITITPGSAAASTAPVSTQKPGFWQENKKSLIPAGIGLLVSYGSKFV